MPFKDKKAKNHIQLVPPDVALLLYFRRVRILKRSMHWCKTEGLEIF